MPFDAVDWWVRGFPEDRSSFEVSFTLDKKMSRGASAAGLFTSPVYPILRKFAAPMKCFF